MDSIKNKIQIGISILLLAGVIAFGYFKGSSFLELYKYTDDLETKIADIEGEVSALSTAVSDAKLIYKDTNTQKNDEIAGVLPLTEDLTSLNRTFDEFSIENNFTNDPFFISSISYSESSESDDGSYMVLPFSIKIESSEDNFYKFLEYIETSGNLDNKVRLMEVVDVSINLSESSEEDLLSFTLELNAYFQK
ncbi:MAG: hypothetical protein ACD_51C00099G0002 [uncultured bacterium]|nr:MAG: hypothetical protein ACD_51C00099G0002 [uncultured bacterium]